METKTHLKARKKIGGAVVAFTQASNEVEKAVGLLDVSIEEDKKRIEAMRSQLKAIEHNISSTENLVSAKQEERKEYLALIEKLNEFTVGGLV